MIKIGLIFDTFRLRSRFKSIESTYGLRGRRGMLAAVGGALVKDVRSRISSRNSGKWKALSPWTIATTGRRKPLVGLGKHVRSQVSPTAVQIYHRSNSSRWNLNTHHLGNVSRAVSNKKMSWSLVAPAAIGLAKSKIVISARGPSVTPARKIWPNQQETLKIARESAAEYAKRKQQ